MAKIKVRLKHYSHLKGSAGVPGDIVEVDSKVAERWSLHGGCENLDSGKPENERSGNVKATNSAQESR